MLASSPTCSKTVPVRSTDRAAAADESDGTIAQMNSATAAVSPMRADRRTIDDFSSLTQRMDRM